MIVFKVNNGKKKVWNYRRMIQNLKPIAITLAIFIIYAIVSTIEYNTIIN